MWECVSALCASDAMNVTAWYSYDESDYQVALVLSENSLPYNASVTVKLTVNTQYEFGTCSSQCVYLCVCVCVCV